MNYGNTIAVGAQPGSGNMLRISNAAPSAHKMPQLDALRAFAVLSVLSVHLVSYPPHWLTIVPLGRCGVQLFFVLSGFLITGILLDSRNEVEAGASRFWMLRQFYARRFLRIFPLYYFVILVGWIIQLPGYTETLGWNLGYSTNFYIVRKGAWIQAAAHLWTLSVEEQFYLIWPWIVLFLPSRRLVPAFIVLATFAIAYRVIAIGWFGRWLALLPFASFDSFGAGSLLAMAQRREKAGNPRLRRILCAMGLGFGIPLFICGLASNYVGSIADSIGFLGINLLFIPLIYGAAQGFVGIPGALLRQKPLLYLGKISYGIYIYHLPVKWLINGSSWLHRLQPAVPRAVVFLAVTVMVSTLSWHLFECPINRLKRFFPYRDTRLPRPIRVIPGVEPEACPPAKG